MRPVMWILTWIAVCIGGALGAASMILLSASHQPATPSPSAAKWSEPPALAIKQRSGEPSRSLIAASQRHNRFAVDERIAEVRR